jgi:hypothetical protein
MTLATNADAVCCTTYIIYIQNAFDIGTDIWLATCISLSCVHMFLCYICKSNDYVGNVHHSKVKKINPQK